MYGVYTYIRILCTYIHVYTHTALCTILNTTGEGNRVVLYYIVCILANTFTKILYYTHKILIMKKLWVAEQCNNFLLKHFSAKTQCSVPVILSVLVAQMTTTIISATAVNRKKPAFLPKKSLKISLVIYRYRLHLNKQK